MTPRKGEEELTTKIEITPEADPMSGKAQSFSITDSVEIKEKDDEKTVKIELQSTPIQNK